MQKSNNHYDADMAMIRIQALEWSFIVSLYLHFSKYSGSFIKRKHHS
jgi:hypothetical protein